MYLLYIIQQINISLFLENNPVSFISVLCTPERVSEHFLYISVTARTVIQLDRYSSPVSILTWQSTEKRFHIIT